MPAFIVVPFLAMIAICAFAIIYNGSGSGASKQPYVSPYNTLYDSYATLEKANQHSKFILSMYDKTDLSKSNRIDIYINKSGKQVIVDHTHRIAIIAKGDLGYMRVEHDSYKFNPATVTYTGATVGGITTGGIHTTEAHYRLSKTVTDRAFLYFSYAQNIDPIVVFWITLNDELFKNANYNEILRKFIYQNNMIRLFNRTLDAGNSALLNASLNNSDKYKAMEQYSNSLSGHYPTVHECANIVDWLYRNALAL